jgi:hypothetical protein
MDKYLARYKRDEGKATTKVCVKFPMFVTRFDCREILLNIPNTQF